MKLSIVQQAIVIFGLFRKQMGAKLSFEMVEKIWGQNGIDKTRQLEKSNLIKDLLSTSKFEDNSVSYEKYRYARRNYKKFLIFNWVKYVAVSGSVAAEIAKPEEDIDIFIVIRNDRVWIYRFLLKLKNLSNGTFRFAHNSKVKNRFCVNFICEERGLKDFPKDIFIFHELFMMKSIYNAAYFNEIVANNSWTADFGVVLRHSSNSRAESSFVLRAVDSFFMFLQLTFMLFTNRKPNLSRYINNTLKGKVISYPQSFKPAVMQSFYEQVAQYERKRGISLTLLNQNNR